MRLYAVPGARRASAPDPVPFPSAQAFADFVTASALKPAPITSKPYRAQPALEYDPLGNDQVGDCGIAGPLHACEAVMGRAATTADALRIYKAVAPGFDQAAAKKAQEELDAATDDATQQHWADMLAEADPGVILTDVFDHVMAHGLFEDGSGKIEGYLAIDPRNAELVRWAIDRFGGLVGALAIPDRFMDGLSGQSGQVLDLMGDPDPGNGHCVYVGGYNVPEFMIDTWGLIDGVTPAALSKYFHPDAGGELWALFWEGWLDRLKDKDASGLDLARLQAALAGQKTDPVRAYRMRAAVGAAAEPWLPPLSWVPSPNFSQRSAEPDLIVIHDCEGGFDPSVEWFGEKQSQVSAHFVIREDGGKIDQCVRVSDKAWHVCNLNSRSIGIEMAGYSRNGFSDALLLTTARLAAYLARTCGIPVQDAHGGARAGITTHFATGAAGGGHSDPSTSASWLPAFVARVQAEADAGHFPAPGSYLAGADAVEPAPPDLTTLAGVLDALDKLGFPNPVKAFQAKHGLDVDGDPGPLTQSAIAKELSGG